MRTSYFFRSPELKSQNQRKFSIIPWTFLFGDGRGGDLPHCREYTQRILSRSKNIFCALILTNLGVCLWCNDDSAGLWNHSKRVQTPVVLIRSLSDIYPWERYEPSYPPRYGLNSISFVLEAWLCSYITHDGWYPLNEETNQTLFKLSVSNSCPNTFGKIFRFRYVLQITFSNHFSRWLRIPHEDIDLFPLDPFNHQLWRIFVRHCLVWVLNFYLAGYFKPTLITIPYHSSCNIMAEGFRFMPLGLVGLRTFRLSAWVTYEQH